jgi:hypothetical protein
VVEINKAYSLIRNKGPVDCNDNPEIKQNVTNIKASIALEVSTCDTRSCDTGSSNSRCVLCAQRAMNG